MAKTLKRAHLKKVLREILDYYYEKWHENPDVATAKTLAYFIQTGSALLKDDKDEELMERIKRLEAVKRDIAAHRGTGATTPTPSATSYITP